MSQITIVTSFSNEGFVAYGNKMLKSACQFLPANVGIWAYYNGVKPEFHNDRVQFIDNYAIPNGVSDFLKRHGKDQRLWGKVPGQKDNFRYAANRFVHKLEALYHASTITSSDILIYLDADVVLFANVPETIFDELLPLPHYACVLDRGSRYHYETGFIGFRTAHSAHAEFMSRFVNYYRHDLFFKEKEWHDAWLCTILMNQMKNEGKISTFNLSPGYEGAGHPWLVSRLAEFSDHLKGAGRKTIGRSFVEDVRGNRTEPYWKNLPSRKDLK